MLSPDTPASALVSVPESQPSPKSPFPGAWPGPHTSSRHPARISARGLGLGRPSMVFGQNGTHRRETPQASHQARGEGNSPHHPPTGPPTHRGPKSQESHEPLGCATAGTMPRPALRPSPGQLPWTLEGIFSPAGWAVSHSLGLFLLLKHTERRNLGQTSSKPCRE